MRLTCEELSAEGGAPRRSYSNTSKRRAKTRRLHSHARFPDSDACADACAQKASPLHCAERTDLVANALLSHQISAFQHLRSAFFECVRVAPSVRERLPADPKERPALWLSDESPTYPPPAVPAHANRKVSAQRP